MQLQTFDGGVAKRVDPALLRPNEAVVYENIDNTSTVLKSALNHLAYTPSQETLNYFYLFKGQWKTSVTDRDYIEYNNILY